VLIRALDRLRHASRRKAANASLIGTIRHVVRPVAAGRQRVRQLRPSDDTCQQIGRAPPSSKTGATRPRYPSQNGCSIRTDSPASQPHRAARKVREIMGEPDKSVRARPLDDRELGPARFPAFFNYWIARILCPFTRADRLARYCGNSACARSRSRGPSCWTDLDQRARVL
jgi:hypothetical protein